MCLRACVRACCSVCLCVCAHMYACVCAHAQAYNRVSLCVCMIYIFAYKTLYIHICAYTYTHRDEACRRRPHVTRHARLERAVATCLVAGVHACTPRFGSRLRVGSCELSPAALAVLALAPLAAMGADGGSPAVLALAPLAVMLADACAPAVLAVAPLAVMLADARAPAVLADAPLAVMLADARAPAVLAVAPLAVLRPFWRF